MKFFHFLLLLLSLSCLTVSLSVGRGRPLASSSSSSSSSSNTAATTGLASVSLQRTAILDGAEWASVQSILLKSSSSTTMTTTRTGTMRIVTGTSIDSDVRVVGIEAPVSTDTSFATCVYQNSMAEIPPQVKDEVAITTMVASLSSVHCALYSNLNEKNDSSNNKDNNHNQKVVVVGGSDYACFVARGLAVMGSDVALISTGNPTVDDYRVMSYNPAVGEMKVGFCNHVGEFSALVDTVSDESNLAPEAPIEDDEDDEDWRLGRSNSGVLALLKSRHQCSTYISTMTASQQIVRDNGVIFGPGQVKDYIQQLTKTTTHNTPSTNSRDTKSTQYIVPPKGFGATVQELLKEGVTYSIKYDGSTILRTWSLPKFWELTSWPRDSAGANVRFGFPVIDDINVVARELDEQEEDDDDIQTELVTKNTSGNPFITEITGVKGLSQEVIEKEKDCLLFLSAKYCRTCKTLAPAYTRYARMNQADNFIFGQADTTGSLGKELGRILGVNSVPLFVLFRNGQRFGMPLTVNKLPSKKLDYALQLLKSGADWDSKAIDKLREKSEKQ